MKVCSLTCMLLVLDFCALLEIMLILMTISFFWLHHCLWMKSGVSLHLGNVTLVGRSSGISCRVLEMLGDQSQSLSLKNKSVQHRPLEGGWTFRQLCSLHFCFPHTPLSQLCNLEFVAKKHPKQTHPETKLKKTPISFPPNQYGLMNRGFEQ